MAANHPTPRQSLRQKGIWPITLLADTGGKQARVPAATKDLSSVGLRIQSQVFLVAGQRIEVAFADDDITSPRTCQVMWTKLAGTSVPGEAGLKFLGVAPWLRKLVK